MLAKAVKLSRSLLALPHCCLTQLFYRKMSDTRTKVKALCIDLSGTLHIGNQAIPGAQSALEKLRKSGLQIKFVTNTTKESKETLHERLVHIGFNIEKDEIFTSLSAAKNLIINKNLRPLLYLQDDAKQEFCDIPQDNPNAVVFGLAPEYFNYEPMSRAFQMLLDGAELIAIHKARYYKDETGLKLGPGPFVTALEFATGCTAEVVGKPEKTFFVEALRSLGCEMDEAVMIGDDARDDVAGAMKTGMRGILVQTGKYRADDEKKVEPQPDAVCADFPAAVEYILNNMLL